jgi:hypothetical protein
MYVQFSVVTFNFSFDLKTNVNSFPFALEQVFSLGIDAKKSYSRCKKDIVAHQNAAEFDQRSSVKKDIKVLAGYVKIPTEDATQLWHRRLADNYR